MNKTQIFIALTLLAAASIVVVMPTANAVETQSDFVGAGACKSCHANEYKIWARGPHSRALESLSAEERKDPACLSCHSMVPSDTSPIFAGIQCESCHGEGKYYARDHIMRDAELRGALGFVKGDEKTCARCHTESSPSIRAFEYAAKAKRIQHWK